MFYDRKIKYVDVYENGEKVQNAGFVRLEVSEEAVSLQLQIAKLRTMDTYSCPVSLVAGEKEAVLDEIQLERGRGFLEKKQLPVNNLAGDIKYVELQEIRVKLPGERVLRCIVREENINRPEKPEQVSVAAVPLPAEEMSLYGEKEYMGTEDVSGEEEEASYHSVILQDTMGTYDAELQKESLSYDEFDGQTLLPPPGCVGFDTQTLQAPSGREEFEAETLEVPLGNKEFATKTVQNPLRREEINSQRAGEVPLATDKWQQLLATYPHIRPFEDMREYLLLKPQDLVVLPERYFKLSGNSFLLHGYYNYEHLILTKEKRRGEECFYIGVPGNFYNKEKQVAVLFGFESFEGKTEPARNGDFGYYMISVEL